MNESLKRLLTLGALMLGLGACTQPGGSVSGTLVLPGGLGGTGADAARPTEFKVMTPPAAPEDAEVVPGEVLVLFDEHSLSAQALSKRYGLRLVRPLALGDMRLLKADGLDGAQTEALARDLSDEPGIAAAFPNWRVYALATPNDEYYPFQWHYPAMNLENAWNIETGQTSPVTVAVVDSGAVAHPDLVGNLLAGYDFVTDPNNGGDGDGRDNNPTDQGQQSGYHGTHVAGTMAAVTNNGSGVAGVSWGGKVVPVRALGVTGTGDVSDILDAIAWSAGESIAGVPNNPSPASVINMSLGANIGQACPAELGTVFRALGNAGTIIVAAAGNDNADTATYFPASCDGVVTVGATGPTGTRAPYSNYGPAIDIMAPGGDVSQTLTIGSTSFPAGVLSTVYDDQAQGYTYQFYQGTSMASPHVAGLVALMKSRSPALTFDEVLSQLRAASRPLSPEACFRPTGTDCGAGSVDAAAALGGSAAPPPPPSTGSPPILAAAFYCTDAQCSDFNEELSRAVTVTPAAQTVNYAIPNLSSGTYVVLAWQDLNDNDLVDAGEPVGVYPDPVPLAAGQLLSNLTIYLEAFTPQGRNAPVQGLERALEGFAE